MVRDTLGEDAVIVSTREEKGGKAVHVTAAVEPAFELGEGGAAAHEEDWLQYDEEQDDSAIAEELTDILLRHSVPEDVIDHIISCATVVGLESPHVALVAALEHLYTFRPLPRKAARKAIMMVGAPGSGKTLAVAKAATRAAMNDLTLGVVTTDTVRAGGLEQLQAFTNLLQVPLERAENASELSLILKDLEECDQVLIDTAGVNPFDTGDIKHLARFIGAADIMPALVMPGGGDAAEAGEIARIMSTIGVEHLIPTRMDVSRRLGGLMAAAHCGHLTFTDASNTPKVAEGLMSLDPENLADYLLPGSFQKGSRRSGRQKRRLS